MRSHYLPAVGAVELDIGPQARLGHGVRGRLRLGVLASDDRRGGQDWQLGLLDRRVDVPRNRRDRLDELPAGTS